MRRKQRVLTISKRRALVAEMLLQGKTYREMAHQTGVKSTQTIFEDVQAVIAEWQAQQKHHVNEWIVLELERIGRIEAQAWIAWEDSRKDAETHTTEVSEDGIKEINTAKGQAGDPRFLDVILKCVARRCELLGLDEPKEIDLPGLLTPEEIEKRRQIRWQKVMPALQTALSLDQSPRGDESVSDA